MDDPSDTALKQRPVDAPRVRYDDDLYGWAPEQAALLRAGRIAKPMPGTSPRSSTMWGTSNTRSSKGRSA